MTLPRESRDAMSVVRHLRLGLKICSGFLPFSLEDQETARGGTKVAFLQIRTSHVDYLVGQRRRWVMSTHSFPPSTVNAASDRQSRP
jgi:hypothetical protein